MVTVRNRRERLRAELEQQIKDVARAHLATEGGAALSIRAIARELGMSAQGLYRYYDSRDALLTALIGDAFAAFADALEDAIERHPATDPAARMIAAGRAYRAWALAQPQQFALIAGGPIPGYVASPDGVTTAAASRAIRVLLDLLADAHRQGRLRPPTAPLPDDLVRGMTRWRHTTTPPAPPEAVHAFLVTWSRLHGLVALEAFGHFAALGDTAATLYEQQLHDLVDELGLADDGHM
jgi:AcrR family transcriptional regulator